MNRAFVFLAIPIALGLAGCTRENSASIVPVGLCYAPTSAATCSMTGGTCSAFLAGTPEFFLQINPAMPASNYDFEYWIQYDNQLPDNTDSSSGRTDTNGAQINGAALSFSVHPSLNGAAPFSIPDQTVVATGMVVPSAGSGIVVLPILPDTIMALLNASIAAGDGAIIEVEVRAKGQLNDGNAFETGPLLVPVLVYNDVFPSFVCPSAGQVVKFICPAETTTSATFACG